MIQLRAGVSGWMRAWRLSQLPRALAVVVVVSLSVGAHGLNVFSAQPKNPPENKLVSPLYHLVLIKEANQPLSSVPGTRQAELAQDRVRVIVQARGLDSVPTIEKTVRAWGGLVEGDYRKLVQGLVPISALPRLARLPEVVLIRPPWQRYLTSMHEVKNEGLPLIGADIWHRAGFTGRGVKVAILDSFRGYKKLLGTALPASVVTHEFGVPLEDDPNLDNTDDAHGTAVAEIIHEVAPEAQLYLVSFGSFVVDFSEALSWLKDEQVDIINTSWAVPSGCLNETGFIEEQIEPLHRDGILWVTSAGNEGQSHWEGNWQDHNKDGKLDFSGTNAAEFEAAAHEGVDIALQWEDQCQASENDYDLFLYDDGGNLIEESRQDNTSAGASEFISTEVPHNGTYRIVVKKAAAARPVKLLLTINSGPEISPRTLEGSIAFSEPAIDPSALSVGAMHWKTQKLESFSSQGPTPDGRIKPDLVAPDCTSNVIFNSNRIDCGFAGTSAAAPFVAGAAALVKQAFSGFGPDQLQNYLGPQHAEDLGAPGKDNQYGWGALTLGLPPEPTPAAPVADFTASPTGGTTPLDVQFTDRSSGEITTYAWDFDDGASSSSQNPSHTYQNPGSYTVMLTVSGPGGSDSKTRSNYINVKAPTPAPVADFTGDPTSGTVPLNVQFSNQSSGEITTYAWDFGDGSSSSSQNPSHTYQSKGSYTVMLTVSGPGGSDSKTRSDYINTSAEIKVYEYKGTLQQGGFGQVSLADPIKNEMPVGVQYQERPNTTQDGRTSDELAQVGLQLSGSTALIFGSPTQAGDFLFLVEARSNNETFAHLWVQITVTPKTLKAEFSAEPTQGSTPLRVRFIDRSQGDITSYSWNFGDGGGSTEPNPSHIYQNPGSYSVRLTISDPQGRQDTRTKADLIMVMPDKEGAMLSSGEAISGRVEAGPGTLSQPYTIVVPPGIKLLTIRLATQGQGNVDLYVRLGQRVEASGGAVTADFASVSPSGSEALTLNDPAPGVYYIAAENQGSQTQAFSLLAATVPVLVALSHSVATPGTVAAAPPGTSALGLRQYFVDVGENAAGLSILLQNLGVGDLVLHVRFGSPVERVDGRIVADFSLPVARGQAVLRILIPRLRAGRYYIAIENREPYSQSYRLTAGSSSVVATLRK